MSEYATSPVTPPELWDYSAVAAYLGVTERTVRKWASQGIGPRPVRFGRAVRFRVVDVTAWVNSEAEQVSA